MISPFHQLYSSLSWLFIPLKILSHWWSNPITLSKNEEKSSGFPGGKGFSSDKSLSFNVSSSVLWIKRQWDYHMLNSDWLLKWSLVLSKSKLVLSSCTGSQELIQKTKQYTTANQWLLNKERTMVIPLWTGTPGQNRVLSSSQIGQHWSCRSERKPLKNFLLCR